MDTARLLIAAVILVLILLAAFWVYRSYTGGDGGNGGNGGNGGPPVYAPTAIGVWDPTPSGKYTCSGSIEPGYCILPTAATAQAWCNSDPKCKGYLTTTATVWHGQWPSYPAAVQVVDAIPTPNTSNPGTFVQKLV